MFYKTTFLYGFAVLVGIIAAITIIFYWKDIYMHINALGATSPVEQTEEIAAAKQEKGLEQTEEEHHGENTVKLTEEQIKQMGLKFQKAGPGNLLLTLSTRGKIILHPDRLAHIIPKAAGVAREVNKNIGDFVRIGDIMAGLESRDMADVKASYLASLSKKRLAASSLEREEKLYKEKVSAGQDYLNAKNVYEESIISVQLARQKLRAFGLENEEIDQLANQNDPDLRLYQIRSPIDGAVIMRHITKGEFVENTATIYQIADLSRVWVDIGIYPKDLYKVKEGQMVEVVVPVENKGSQAKLIYVSPIVADETITAKAVAELDNPQGIWRPGVFVKVNIATEKISLPLVIPKEAIQNIDGRDCAFVVTPDGFERRFIKIGQSDNENVEVISGLNPGEQYVANKTFLLKAELGKTIAKEH
jgi:cobalt-zinc-cadmium efflux system membrane fusion protein